MILEGLQMLYCELDVNSVIGDACVFVQTDLERGSEIQQP